MLIPYQIWRSKKDDRWYWHLRAANHKIILQSSKGYKAYKEAFETLWNVWKWSKENTKEYHSVAFSQSRDLRFYFEIKDGTTVLARSQTYASPRNMNKGLRTVVSYAINENTSLIRDPNHE